MQERDISPETHSGIIHILSNNNNNNNLQVIWCNSENNEQNDNTLISVNRTEK